LVSKHSLTKLNESGILASFFFESASYLAIIDQGDNC